MCAKKTRQTAKQKLKKHLKEVPPRPMGGVGRGAKKDVAVCGAHFLHNYPFCNG